MAMAQPVIANVVMAHIRMLHVAMAIACDQSVRFRLTFFPTKSAAKVETGAALPLRTPLGPVRPAAAASRRAVAAAAGDAVRAAAAAALPLRPLMVGQLPPLMPVPMSQLLPGSLRSPLSPRV